MLEAHQEKIIGLFHKNELLLAELYDTFVGLFPEHSSFWHDLAKDEREHAAWVKKLYGGIKKELVLFDEGKIKTFALQSIIKNVEGFIRKAENREVDLKAALAHAHYLEKSLVERKVFSHFEFVDEEAAEIMAGLAEDSRIHAMKVEELRNRFN